MKVNVRDGQKFTRTNKVLCDVCARILLAKDAILIKDKHNRYNGMLVCPEDYTAAQPQDSIRAIREHPLTYTDRVRPPQVEDYVTSNVTSRPSAPKLLDYAGGALVWQGPDLPYGRIIGYQVTRDSIVVVGDTGNQALYYDGDELTSGTFTVSAINEAGFGDESNEVVIV